MKKIQIKNNENKIEIPMGIYVNGFIINAPMSKKQESVVKLNHNTTSTPTIKEK
jgi:hypothetical protein